MSSVNLEITRREPYQGGCEFGDVLAKNDAVPADVRKLIRDEWTACVDCDEEEFLTQGLALFSEKLREGLDAYDADRYEQCAVIMKGLENHKNPFVATHATAYEIKSLIALRKLLDAKARVDFLLADGGQRLGEYTYLEPEIRFLRGFCLLSDLNYDAAHKALSRTGVAECSQCHSAKLPHRVCPTCGYYNGREVVTVAEELSE